MQDIYSHTNRIGVSIPKFPQVAMCLLHHHSQSADLDRILQVEPFLLKQKLENHHNRIAVFCCFDLCDENTCLPMSADVCRHLRMSLLPKDHPIPRHRAVWWSPKAVPVPWHSATLISLALSLDSIMEVLLSRYAGASA